MTAKYDRARSANIIKKRARGGSAQRISYRPSPPDDRHDDPSKNLPRIAAIPCFTRIRWGQPEEYLVSRMPVAASAARQMGRFNRNQSYEPCVRMGDRIGFLLCWEIDSLAAEGPLGFPLGSLWRRNEMTKRSVACGGIAAGLILALAACTNPYDPAQRAVGGGLLGAGAGAAIGGAVAGGHGAALGAAIGGATGALTGAATTPPPPPPPSAYYGPPGGYGQPAPGYGYPASGYAQPGPGYGPPPSGYGQPGPGYGYPPGPPPGYPSY
jgi:hypothetical protein